MILTEYIYLFIYVYILYRPMFCSDWFIYLPLLLQCHRHPQQQWNPTILLWSSSSSSSHPHLIHLLRPTHPTTEQNAMCLLLSCRWRILQENSTTLLLLVARSVECSENVDSLYYSHTIGWGGGGRRRWCWLCAYLLRMAHHHQHHPRQSCRSSGGWCFHVGTFFCCSELEKLRTKLCYTRPDDNDNDDDDRKSTGRIGWVGAASSGGRKGEETGKIMFIAEICATQR